MTLHRKLKASLVGCAIALTMSAAVTPANADVIVGPTGTIPGGFGLVATSNLTSNAELIAWLDATYNLDLELYKQNVGGGGDTGGFAGSYQTTFSNTANDPQDAFIDYISGQPLNCAAASNDCYLLVKDGAQTPAAYLFNLAGLWNGTDNLYLRGFWPTNGAISHIAFYGNGDDGGCTTPGGCTPEIPEPGTVALLGAALFAAAAARRRRI